MKRFLPLLLILPLFINGQNTNWTHKTETEKAFIKNIGQFKGRSWQQTQKIEYAVTQNPYYIFFTKQGLTYRLDRIIRNPKRIKGDPKSPKRTNLSELVHVTFLGSNPNVEITSEGKTDNYYSYAMKDRETKETTNLNHINGYEKITYKNLYNNIDIEYFFHPDGGVKYNVILHPGADPSQIKMYYKTDHTNVKNENVHVELNQQGQIEINSTLGKIIEHKPFTYYNSSNIEINSKYVFENNILTFDIDNYDNSQKVIIDPWMVIETFNSSNAVWEVENDGAGNTYVTGGETPMVLKKYNAAGALQWTYNTPWDTASVWLGTLATDAAGNSYVTSGTSPQMHKVDNAGNMVWTTTLGGSLGFQSEWWSITFNCDESKLIVGGTWVNGLLSFDFFGGVFDIDVATGNVLNDQQFTQVNIGFGFPPPTPIEVRSISSSKNAKYILLTHDSVLAINQDLGTCPTNDPIFQKDNQNHLSYKCENYLPINQNGGGLKALVSNDNFFYTHTGSQVLQWDVTNGTLLSTVNLPGGNSGTDLFGELTVYCSGLDVDNVGNVYAGSMDRVVKFDANLNFISQAMTSGGFTVYDVSVNSNGDVVAGGAQGNNAVAGNRTGRVEAFNMSATGQYALVCCDANFCQVGPFCDTDAAVNLSPNTAGGTWSSVPATAGLSAGGVFDPAVAGSGTYTITYTLACGSNSITVLVGSCTAMSVCVETNGDLTVTGGTGPYSWDEPGATTSNDCATCGGVDVFGTCVGATVPCVLSYGFINFATGTTVVPSVGADTIQITDGLGNSIIINDISTLPPCGAACDATITPTGPYCLPAAGITLVAAQSGGTWTSAPVTAALNGTTGTFDLNAAGIGSFTITYTLGCGDTDNITVVIDSLPNTGIDGALAICPTDPATDLFTQLGGSPATGGTWSPAMNSGTGMFDPTIDPANTYTYSLTNSCGTSSNDVVVTITANPDPGTNGVATVCAGTGTINLMDSLNGTPDAGGTWSPVLTSGTGIFDPATDLAGIYTYTVNLCGGGTATADVVVTIMPGLSPGTNGVATVCAGTGTINLMDSLNGTPDAGGTWSPVLTSGTGVFDPAIDAAGTYTYSVTDCLGNPQTADVVVTITPVPNTGIDGALVICPADPATDLFLQLGGTPTVGGTWSPALTSGTGMFDPATDATGTYTYTLTNSCGTSSNDVVVTITANPDPGTNGIASLCSNAGTINLTDSLTGTPSFGGTWSPALASGTAIFDPAVDGAGTYTYTVNLCGGGTATADVIVSITLAPNTGADGTLSTCPTDPATDLFTQLGGSPDVGGTWSPALTSGTGMFDPATDAGGTYTYTLTNSCGTSSNDVVVTITANPDPGTNGVANLCSNAGTINLMDSLTGTPSVGGTWSPALTSGTDLFDPTIDPGGTYIYTVIDCGGNPLTADVVITIIAAPNTGINGTLSICNTDPATDLFNQLGGTPDAGGTWSPVMTSGTGMFDPATDAAGSYTYTVTNSCGSSSNDVIVSITSCTIPTAGYTVSNDTICEGDCINFTDQSTGGATSWLWTFTGGSPNSSTSQNPTNICFNTAGTHTIKQVVTNSNGSDSATTTIVVNSAPSVNAGIDVPINLGGSVTLTATGSNGTYTWSPPTWLSCVVCPSTTTTPDETITYTVTVVDSNGCSTTDDVTVVVNFDNVVFVPNIFSPNGDGNNDFVYVQGKGIANFNFFIYDRWGEKVFETSDLTQGWNGEFRGKKMNNAVFVYYLEVTFIDGSEATQKGDITLIR
jgi:gliding motility-associated-like protein